MTANETHAIVLSQLITTHKVFAEAFPVGEKVAALLSGLIPGHKVLDEAVAKQAEVVALPAIILGSFNAHRASSSMEFLLDQTPLFGITHSLELADTWEAVYPGVTKTPTMMTLMKAPVELGAVDGILMDSAIGQTVVDARIVAVDSLFKSSAPSDHYAVMAEFVF